MRALLGLLLLLAGLPSWAEPELRISEIRFEGNQITEERILRQEMWLREGDVFDPDLLERSRQALMNLGLFRHVQAESQSIDGQQRLLIRVEERFFLLPIPLVGAKPDDDQFNYGVELRYDNLWGLNQRLKLAFEHRRQLEGEEPLMRQWLLDYRYPRVMGSRNNLDFYTRLRSQRRLISEQEGEGAYHRDQYTLGLGLSRWLDPQGRSEGWRLGGRLNLIQHDYSEQWGAGLAYQDAQALELQWDVSYYRVAEHPYHRAGDHYGYTLSHSLTGMGSDYSYLQHMLYWRAYRPLDWVDANLNTHLRLGLASGSSFKLPAYSLGGNSLRGYRDELATGNAMLVLNMEYHHRISGYRQMRAVLFTDVGNAWDEPTSIRLTGFYPALGVGLRWRVQYFVDTTLRVDYGYGLRDETQRFYFSTTASF
ncbi:MAG: BamA/TamA family outer membrane protein [Chromatiales bacterium]|nr:BamA/TamA family outer membrane protein [Gammaproteobacteria bacterium]MBW6476264.1 BamA/TamA family outer membrane protein [Chromatiales bacterium]